MIASPRINPTGLDAQFVKILSRLICTLAGVLVFLQGGQFLGIPLTTLLASAGVGGLAVALAVQDTLRNVFGTIMLLSDKPFRVGERIIFDKYDWTVEDIGLRSTKVRLLSGHLATIPNDKLAKADIENVGRRTYIRRVNDLHIPLETTRKDLESAVAAIREIMADQEGLDPQQPPQVFFHEFAPQAFVIRVVYWFASSNQWDSVACNEALNFQFLQALESRDISLTPPRRGPHDDVASKLQ